MDEELATNRQDFYSLPNLFVERFMLMPAVLSFPISIPSKRVTSTAIRAPVVKTVSQCGEDQQDGLCWPLPNLLELSGKNPLVQGYKRRWYDKICSPKIFEHLCIEIDS